ncbi:MAG: RHS repeat-associated core domain-containing protein [Pseudomonadota bacterium]
MYLFTEAGKYQDKSAYTNASGQAVFALPAQSYKIRADYLCYQFWSDPFTQSATRLTIPLGRTALHVTKNGQNIASAPVYLFKASGSSLGKTVKTDATGVAIFDLPEHDYKFRIDYQGAQHWSDVITPLPDEETTIELKLDLLTLNLTNNPNPVRVDENPPAFRTKGVLVASLDTTSGLLSQPVQAAPIPVEKTYFFINDHLGTPLALTDEAGVKVWEADYWPFGDVYKETGSIPQGFRFPGQSYDAETGLHYNYHRYYDPKTGRYLTADPIGLSGGINLFAYCLNDPVNLDDLFGLFVFAKRPLSTEIGWDNYIPIANPIDDFLNTELVHEHGFFEDGSGDNVGFFPVGVRSEDPTGRDYRVFDRTHYDDDIMREAIRRVTNGEYSLAGSLTQVKNNCQDWAERLREVYHEIERERKKENPCSDK